MADLRVAHVIIRGQADSVAVGLDVGVGAICQKIVQIRGLCVPYSVAGTLVAQTNAIHNDKYNRLIHLYKTSIRRAFARFKFVGCSGEYA